MLGGRLFLPTRNTQVAVSWDAEMDDPLTVGDLQDDLPQNYLESFPFLPNQFYSELPLPRAMQALSQLICTVLTGDGSLSQGQKQMLLRGVGTLLRNDACALYFRDAPQAKSPQERQLLKFSLKLAKLGPRVSIDDIELLRQVGFDDGGILEAAITTAIGRMFCTLADGLVPPPESAAQLADAGKFPDNSDPVVSAGSYLNPGPSLPDSFPPYQFFSEKFGFVPNIFRAQALRPGLLEIEAKVMDAALLGGDFLSRLQKEKIMLAVSAKNLNTYFVTVHSQILKTLGVSAEEADQIVSDHRSAALSDADKFLLDFARGLANFERKKFSVHDLKEKGFANSQIIEAIALSALANFLNTLQFGLGAVPDFPPRHIFPRQA